jgi:DNA-binding LacI/PurR family transcriptional regulator
VTKRATIADIAQRAGLSKGAVSYALNGLPGVSEATRQRVLKLAAEMGWRPNSAARALSASRAGALGLVMARPASTLGVEPFFMKLLSGIENTLAARSTALLLQVVPDHDAEVEAYRRWWAERRVDGIFLIDLRTEDKRVQVLEELGLPAVVIGGPGHHGRLPGVWSDDASAMAMVVEYLAAWATGGWPGWPAPPACSTPSCAARPSARSRTAWPWPRRSPRPPTTAPSRAPRRPGGCSRAPRGRRR